LDTNPTKHKLHRPSFHAHIVSPHQIGEDENAPQMYLWTMCECVNDQLIVPSNCNGSNVVNLPFQN